MKYLLFVAAFTTSLSFGSFHTSDKESRVAKVLKTLQTVLPAGKYTGKLESGHDCTVTVETRNDADGNLEDFDLSMAVASKLTAGKVQPKHTFNLFNDGRDGSDSSIVHIAQSTDRGAGTTDVVRILWEEIGSDYESLNLKAPTLAVTRSPAKKLTGIRLDTRHCEIQ